MTQKDSARFWLHFPIGFIIASLILLCPVLPQLADLLGGVRYVMLWRSLMIIGGLGFFGFYGYEFMNDWRKKDASYKDIMGGLTGFLIAPFIWIIVMIIQGVYGY